MEKKTNRTITSKRQHHVLPDQSVKHKGLKLLDPKSQVELNPQLKSENVQVAVASINRKFENFLFEKHISAKITDPIVESLQKKSEKSGIDITILEQVFKRGLSAWNPYICKNATQEQWAFARVNSFISGGKAVELDSDLAEANFKTKEDSQTQSTDPNNPMSRLDGTKQGAKTFRMQTPFQPKPKDATYQSKTTYQQNTPTKKKKVVSERIIHTKYGGTDSPCWTGYVQKGTKIKNGKVVPNCVPIGEEAGCPLEDK